MGVHFVSEGGLALRVEAFVRGTTHKRLIRIHDTTGLRSRSTYPVEVTTCLIYIYVCLCIIYLYRYLCVYVYTILYTFKTILLM